MSKSKINTRQIILNKALEMFNERGIEYVGLRELAGILDIRVSNITYYFPTKDDLVYELSLELSRLNALLIVQDEKPTMLSFLEMLRRVYHNHIQFRCLLLSVVHLTRQNKHMAVAYKKTQKIRNVTMSNNLENLEKSGYLQLKDPEDLEFLVSGISLISRFWISESALSSKHLNADEQIMRYLRMITRLLHPYTTGIGKKETTRFFMQYEDN